MPRKLPSGNVLSIRDEEHKTIFTLTCRVDRLRRFADKKTRSKKAQRIGEAVGDICEIRFEKLITFPFDAYSFSALTELRFFFHGYKTF
jgi:hypothetical protein